MALDTVWLTADSVLYDNDEKDAVLFEVFGDEVWVPRSLIMDRAGDEVIEIPRWFAIQEGILEFCDEQL